MHAASTDYSLEQTIATHLATTAWEDLPARSRDQAVRAVLWYLATGLEGASEPGQVPVLRYIESHSAQPEATVIGVGKKTSAELAALFNGRAGKAWEHEDKYWVDETIGFAVGCCVVPAALAAAEVQGGISGKQLATAVALGIDLEIRLLRPLGLGFVFGRTAANATFALGNYGAAAAAAKIFGLSEDAIMDALGLAHSQAAGNYQGQAEGRGVALQAGFAVRNGLTAARLARAGMQGPRASISGVMGLYAVHFPASQVNFDQITADLGRDFLNADLGFKGYPCGVVAHPALDAAIAARNEIKGRPIVGIEVFGPPSLSIMASPIAVKRAPKTAIESQFSIPWSIACALYDGHYSVEHCFDTALLNPAIQRIAAAVSIDMAESHLGTRIRVTLADGFVIEPPTVTASKGHPNNPLSTPEIEAVLRRAADQLRLEGASVERALELLRELDKVNDVTEIISLLSPRQSNPEQR